MLLKVRFYIHDNPAVNIVCEGTYRDTAGYLRIVSGFGDTIELALAGMTFQLPEGWDD
jgi:hypothetical protein